MKFLNTKRGSEFSGDALNQCISYLRKFLHKLRLDWETAGRHKERYLLRQENWLNGVLDKRITALRDEPSTPFRDEPSTSALGEPSTSARRGRPVKRFSEVKSSRKRSLTTSLGRHCSDKPSPCRQKKVKIPDFTPWQINSGTSWSPVTP